MEYWVLSIAAGIMICNFISWVRLYQKSRQQNEQAEKERMVFLESAAAAENFDRQFLPVDLLNILEIQNTSLKTSDVLKRQKNLQVVILNGNIAGFQELIHDTEITEVYRLINQILSCSIPVIYSNGGMIDGFRNAGITALFNGQMADGLNAAISICEKMISFEQKQMYQNFAVGLCYGPVMIGVVGYDSRLAVQTLSGSTGFGEFLQKKAPKYYARILAAESYTNRIEGFAKEYNHRFLGYFYIRDTDSMEKIYDVFDGDTSDIRNRKRKTRMLFEKGAHLFVERNYKESRTYFIEVLKADRSDKAAKEYVFLCDKYSSLSKENIQNAVNYIESY